MAINLTLNDFRSVLGKVNDGNVVLKQDQSGIEKANYGSKILNFLRTVRTADNNPQENVQVRQSLLAAIHNPWTHIISHPGDGTAELFFEPIVLAARDTHTLLEINSSSMIPSRHKEVARPNNLEILRLCRKHDIPVILGSDAHISFSIADYRYALPLLAETDFPDELVMNYWPEQALAYLGIENSKC